jgi:general secretion pathway protein A
MYNQTFGLNKNPFNMTPDPAFLYLTRQHREALAGLTYAVVQRKGFIVLTGEAGTGKTTLLARVLQFIPPSRLQFSLILNPTLTPSEFLEMALLDFGVKEIPASKAQRLWRLQTLLVNGRLKGLISVLIVDEAHKLPTDTLEEIRLLGNYEGSEQKLLQIVLVGQNELDAQLNRQELRQLKQRIALRLSIRPLEPGEIGSYIAHRWTVAGGGAPPFRRDAILRIAQGSRGIPRLVNSVCDNALTLAFADGDEEVTVAHVETAISDLRLEEVPVRPASVVAVMPLQAPATVATPASEPLQTAIELPVLQHYANNDSRGDSRWTRWRDKLGFNRSEPKD